MLSGICLSIFTLSYWKKIYIKNLNSNVPILICENDSTIQADYFRNKIAGINGLKSTIWKDSADNDRLVLAYTF